MNNFKQIIDAATNDNTAMNGKRAIKARQECLDVADAEQCLQDVEQIAQDPAEILGGKKKRQYSPGYSDAEQQGICAAFRGVSHTTPVISLMALK